MELILTPTTGDTFHIPLDGISYTLISVNPHFSESVSKTYSLAITIPVRLLPVRQLGLLLTPGGKYAHNTLPGYLSDGAISLPCTVKFEKDLGHTVQLSIEYADLPIDMLSRKISQMDLGSWSFDQPLSSWAFSARTTTGGLISFPMIYAPEFFKTNYDENFLGDTDYINFKEVKTASTGAPVMIFRPTERFVYDSQHPEDFELHNDNALFPCVHLITLLSKICSLSGYSLASEEFPSWMQDIYLSTLKYPDLPEPPVTDIVQTGVNPGERTFPVGDAQHDGYDWIFFEQYIDIPRQLSGCTITVTLTSGTLYPCKDMSQEVPYGKYVPTDFKCILDNFAEVGLEVEETLVREVIEDEIDLDKSPLEFVFKFVRTQRGNGYARPRFQLRGSNVHSGSTYPDSVRDPYVEDLQATITYAFDYQKTYEIFLRPEDYSSYVQIKTSDFLSFDTFSDLYTSIQNAFGLSLLPDAFSRIIHPHSPSLPPHIRDLQEYSPSDSSRTYNDASIYEEKNIVISSSRDASPVIVVSPSDGVKIYPNNQQYEISSTSDSDDTVKDTGFYPLPEKRRMASFEAGGAGENCLFFAPLAVIDGISLTEPFKAYSHLETDGKMITLELDSLYELCLKYLLSSVYTKEQYEIRTFLPANVYLSISTQDKIHLCNKDFDIIEMQAESSGDGYIVTFTLFG